MSFREYLSRLRSVFYRPLMSRRSAVIFLALSLTFIIAIVMRVYPSLYGWYLNEFDPYWDYYASAHVVTLAQQHGLFYALFNNPSNCPSIPPANVTGSLPASYCRLPQSAGLFQLARRDDLVSVWKDCRGDQPSRSSTHRCISVSRHQRRWNTGQLL